MMNKDHICFDIGNVLCNVDFSFFIKKLSKSINISIEDVNYFLDRTQKLHDLGLTDIRSELSDHLKIKSSPIVDDLIVEWNKTVTAHTFMISTLNDLIKNNIKIALLSNIGTEHAALMRNILTPDIYDNSIKFFSCFLGARKPTHLYYKTFLDMYSNFRGSIYLDDRAENVEAGREFGFKSQHFALDSFGSMSELSDRVAQIKNSMK